MLKFSQFILETDHTDKFYHEGPRGEFSEEHRRKMSEAAKRRKRPARLGIKFTEEGKQNLKKGWEKRKLKGLGTPGKGKKHSPETIEKMAAAKRGKPSWNKGVPCQYKDKISSGLKVYFKKVK